jgi:hypothetical protein
VKSHIGHVKQVHTSLFALICSSIFITFLHHAETQTSAVTQLHLYPSTEKKTPNSVINYAAFGIGYCQIADIMLQLYEFDFTYIGLCLPDTFEATFPNVGDGIENIALLPYLELFERGSDVDGSSGEKVVRARRLIGRRIQMFGLGRTSVEL